ncbi:GyrI-like domain-containing protein [Loigolactobacillus iwatensis]|uniref:GyrI-like domain-containing protein n=1 Tax=Loigolactobacillus iwatensis TaxID=1267156 RepID=UPI000F7DDDC7|nr:GyrI-like domain-containing protein [Loigolactobacillus iwatensis]
MTFSITTLPEQRIAGLSTVLPTPKSYAEMAEMSKVKTDYLEKLAQADLAAIATDQHFYGVNYNANGDQNYLAGVKVIKLPAGYTDFTVAAGQYAKFTTKAASRNAIDQFIGQSYGELAQSADYQVAGNFNLEVVDSFIDGKTAEFSIYMPVTGK